MVRMTSTLPDLHAVQTLPELLAFRAALTPGREAYRQCDPATGHWTSLSWSQAQERVRQWSRAIAASGLPQGARIAVLLPNGLDAMSIDQAAMATGCVPVPLHAIDNPGSIAYILQDAEVSLLVVQDAAQWERVRGVGLPLPHLMGVVVTAQAPAQDAGPEDVPVAPLSAWLQHAAADTPLPPPPGPGDLAAIVYTSGTTGKPKGVMLTHANVIADVKAVLQRVSPTQDDVFLSFLPLSHTFERTGGYYLPMASGSCVAYARSVAQLADDMLAVRPTVLVSVPRIYERVHAKLIETLSSSPWKMQLFQAAQAVGWRRFCAAQRLPAPQDDGSGSWMRALPWPLLRALVARPLLARFGGRVRVAVSGGAPLPPAIAQCFLGLGLPLVQGYGMTETTPVVSVNTLDDNDPSTVGRALPGVEVRIGENRELQVRGPIVMKGYWKRPEDTARTIGPDGWLGTGDQAEIVDGRIRILGRIKEIIVTSTGEKVPPADLELAITADPLFEQAFVVGEQRPFIACVAAVQAEEWRQLAGQLGLDPDDPASLAHPSATRAALARIEKLAAGFPRYAVPRAVHLVREPWTIENALMTPTLKLKRNSLMAHYADAIEAMYQRR
ncbi:long-chain fatty acid--CoA ligase [Alicycliphilus denitrificans]|uniref:Long-chain fatty acid--CoA ligase n=2 Tax=Alicycliphilus denitrificans TaxID=179636 RepID=A0A420KID0_9BURK|nr:long-chain fatty acid--CoA ligase [Alicycliphilus denitrificans]RKJ99697.1 long-chain fatty acid--CoA ligase [Alicycliphilus denitrificans]